MESPLLTKVMNIKRQSERIDYYLQRNLQLSFNKIPVHEIGRNRTPLKEQASFRKEQEKTENSPIRKFLTKKCTTKTLFRKYLAFKFFFFERTHHCSRRGNRNRKNYSKYN